MNNKLYGCTWQTAISFARQAATSFPASPLTKPFNIDELTARVRALLRRADTTLASDNLSFRDIVLEPNNYQVTKNGQELKLIPKEFAILELLMRCPGKVFSPEAIIDRVWDQSEYKVTDVIRTHIMNLRRKLGTEAIETVHGVGYKLSSINK